LLAVTKAITTVIYLSSKNLYRMKKLYGVVVLSLVLNLHANAQDTWQQVYTLLNINCAGAGCHGGDLQDFNVTLPSTDLYNALVGVAPINATAAGKDDKYIDPGYPSRSYLLRKVANCLSNDLSLDENEGAPMLVGTEPMLDQEIELIRQWILFGAPETGSPVNKALVDEFYTIGGMPKLEQPTPPKSCEGFQVHMGPIFFAPNEESEFFQKYDLKVADTLEVTGLEIVFNDESHHFILRKFKNGTAQNWPQGLTPLNPLTAFDSDKEYVMAWQNNETYHLPNGTAYVWNPDESLDLNFHMFNYNNEILAGEVYINVYTQPKGKAEKEMKSSLITNLGIFIPNNNQPVTFSASNSLSNASIWTLTSHTHKYGKNYDIFLKNADGSKGRMVYDGTYNYLQGFDTGVYDWEHPPTALFEPFLNLADTVNNGQVPNGLIHEATFQNFGPRAVTFGFTSEDEMMIYCVQYVDGVYDIPANPSWTSTCTSETYVNPCMKDSISNGIANTASNSVLGLNIYPNPSAGITNIDYNVSDNATVVTVEVVNLLGEKVMVLASNELQTVGQHQYQLDGSALGQGIYLVRLLLDGRVSTQKLIVTAK
jgi:hypothetical protein